MAAPLSAWRVRKPPPLPAWTYWEDVDVPPTGSVEAAALPVDIAALERTPAMDAQWRAAKAALRDAVRQRGFAVTRSAHPFARIGDFYAALRDDGIPWVVTLDALFFLTHLAIDRAVAEVDDRVVYPSLLTLLRRLDLRLAQGSLDTVPDTASALLVARGVVAVALAFARPDYVPPAELSALVSGEKSRVISHSAIGISPWLGIPVDYSAMAPRGWAAADDAHVAAFRAMAWLRGACLALEGRGEDGTRMPVDVATARTHARAAMFLSRLVDYDVDAEAATAWTRITGADDVLVGEPDDTTPRDISAAARANKLDVRSAAWVADAVAVDRVRRTAARQNPPHLDDAAGGADAVRANDDDPGSAWGARMPTFRLVPPRLTPDSELLQSLVFPFVGAMPSAAASSASRDPRRALPSALDVAAWLGSAEARAWLHEHGDDAYPGYAAALERLSLAQPPLRSLKRHKTTYSSSLDAVATFIAPSVGDRVQPSASTLEWRLRKAAVATTAWTEIRHDAMALSRVHVADVPNAPPVPGETIVPVFVEPHPEAIAKLLALTRQVSRALLADSAIDPEGPAVAVLHQVQDILWDALGMAVHEAADQPVPPGLIAAVASLPARLRALEAALGERGGANVPMAVDVHLDVASSSVLEETVGRIEELWVVMREPGTHRAWLALGASLPHAEFAGPMGARLSDSAWQARVASEQDRPEPLERAYFRDRR